MMNPSDSQNDISPKGWRLRLYIAGQTAKSLAAISNLHRIVKKYLPEKIEIEIIDLLENPELAAVDHIIAIPTLIRKSPMPICKVIGDLSSTEKTLIGLQIKPPTNGS